MALYLGSADLEDARRAAGLGFILGATTNPTHAAMGGAGRPVRALPDRAGDGRIRPRHPIGSPDPSLASYPGLCLFHVGRWGCLRPNIPRLFEKIPCFWYNAPGEG